MKANLREDIITTLTENGTTDIGQLPKNVGMERLRFDGERVIDLETLDYLWVRCVNGVFELHVIKVPGSQKINMKYKKRKILFEEDDGTIRLKTEQEITNERLDGKRKQILVQLNQKLKGKIGDMTELSLNNTMLIMALIVYVRQQPPALSNFFDSLIPFIMDAFPLNKWKEVLKEACKELKDAMDDYHNKIDNL